MNKERTRQLQIFLQLIFFPMKITGFHLALHTLVIQSLLLYTELSKRRYIYAMTGRVLRVTPHSELKMVRVQQKAPDEKRP